MLLPYPTLPESVAALPLPWLFRLNGIIGECLKSKYFHSGSLGLIWTYHGYQLAEYALLCIERANPYPNYLWNNWWARDKQKDGTWRYPPSFFTRYQKKDTGLPSWVGDPLVHESHKLHLTDSTHPLYYTDDMIKKVEQLRENALSKIRHQIITEHFARRKK